MGRYVEENTKKWSRIKRGNGDNKVDLSFKYDICDIYNFKRGKNIYVYVYA